jgi:AraC-like DNA-binding protein
MHQQVRHVAPIQGDSEDEISLERLQSAVAELLCAISTVLHEDRTEFRERVRRAAELLQLASPTVPSTLPARAVDSALGRGGLAPWQARKIINYIEANLEATVRVDDLASLVNLSQFHFSRAFRQTFDESPHAFVMRRRIERAQGLMLSSSAPLAQIAADCGLSDQAHFTRLFRQLVGEPPGAWRRARATCL